MTIVDLRFDDATSKIVSFTSLILKKCVPLILTNAFSIEGHRVAHALLGPYFLGFFTQ